MFRNITSKEDMCKNCAKCSKASRLVQIKLIT